MFEERSIFFSSTRSVTTHKSQPPIHYQKDCKYVNSSMMFLVTSLLVIFTLQSQTISVNFRGIFITTPNPNTEKLSAEFIWWNFSTRCHCNLMIWRCHFQVTDEEGLLNITLKKKVCNERRLQTYLNLILLLLLYSLQN